MEPGKYYHIYTHANGSENLFREEENYRYFLHRFGSFIPPVAHTLAYCLMPNHLHLLVQIKNENSLAEALKELKKYKTSDLTGFKNLSDLTTLQSEALIVKNLDNFKNLSDLTTPQFDSKNLTALTILQFSHLFNAYSKAYNKMYRRMGSLFTRSFHRKEIQNDHHLTTTIRYIHRNPVSHGFVNHPGSWPWSSYTTLLSRNSPDWLSENLLIQWFGSITAFQKAHEHSPQEPESPGI